MTRGRQESNADGSNIYRDQDRCFDGGCDLADVIRQMMETMKQQQEVILRQNQQCPLIENRGCPYEKFLIYRYPNFMGTEGPMKANKWLLDLDKTFEINGCTGEQKERFKGEFDNRFFPESMKTQKAQEFATLVQGNLTVEQYAAKFMELGRFAPHLIATEKMQAQKFQVRLNPRIHSYVAGFCIHNFQELVNVVAIAEAKQRSVTAQINLERKSASTFTTSGNNAKRRIIQGVNKGKCVIIAPPVTC
ncbi:uncharacterized protein LOC121249411 [Juglans microcarpa x Juglans regia]|uniref:uncharacterized protein LOC121249411 n=1 Tax=Juglans microcarpa x Juglans regia TaxID=2249226 RepID=UPI001B7F3487|nr:uncharacterized protein LOC121249411 [Juglans microcarpa x Juglans regia]